MSRSSSISDQVIAAELIKTRGNATQAARNLSPHLADSTVQRMGWEWRHKASIRRAVRKALRDQGATPAWAVGKIVEAGAANKDDDVHPDHGVRLKAVDLAMRLADAFPAEAQVAVTAGDTYAQYNTLHLNESPAVTRWIADNGRYPTDSERVSIEQAYAESKRRV